ncbi:spermatogenesis-associated protein 7 isoform X2 [Rhinoderma darwinii]|uniref:spermatogenesis-associated protein 7 isoform X2 n=1 Tax=Rhinoderma darwinii TaxID=43563 RepID=UPI003F66BEDF
MSPGYSAAPDEPPRATHNGSGDGGARPGSRAPSIPMCGVSSPFRGHLSTKSNVFCIGHSSRLSDQYRIRDRMLIHYNKIISAKAAVDCSIPKSMIKSIKYSDQQRRERMKKEVARLEKTSSHSAASSRPPSRDSADSIMLRKDTYDPYTLLLRRSPYSDPGPVYSPSSFISSPRRLRSPAHTGEMHGPHPDFSRLPCDLSTACSSPCKFQDNQTKTYSGDLLEKHSHHFTNKERPFTPRTLKTQAKSALAQSRYYTPPRRKKRVAETQTDISSFRRTSQTPDRETSPIRYQEGNNENLLLSDEDEEGPAEWRQRQRSSSREEELVYLKFVADVTNEILTLGLFSDRVLERVFQRHLEENRHRLDEGKMRHLLDILRKDLDCKDESNVKTVGNRPGARAGYTHSPFDEILKRNYQEEASSYLDDIVTHQHLHEDNAKHQDYEPGTRDIEHGDGVPIDAGERDDDHHQEDDGDHLTPRLSHDRSRSTLYGTGPDLHDDTGSPARGPDDLQVVKETSEDNLLPDVSEKDQTSEDTFSSSGDVPTARPTAEETGDLETLEELQQNFSEVVQVSSDDDDGGSDLEEDEAAQTND